MVKIEISNRTIYFLFTLGILSLFAVGVYAFGGSSPSVVGHSAGELDLSAGVNGNALFNGDVLAQNFEGDGSRLANIIVRITGSATCDSTKDGLLRYVSGACSRDDFRESSFDICMRNDGSYVWNTIQSNEWSDISCNQNGCPVPGDSWYECTGITSDPGCYDAEPAACYCIDSLIDCAF